FRGGGDGVAVAARFLLCAGGGDGFSSWAGHARGSLRLGRERDAANMVGPRAGGITLEPRFVCGDEMPVLLLPGIGVGVDARAGGPAGRNDRGLLRRGSHWRALCDVDYGGVLFVAGFARASGGVALCRGNGTGSRREESCAGGDVIERREVKEAEELKEKNARVAAFFDLDGTLTPGPSLEKRFFRRLRYRKLIGRANYLRWIWEAV